MSNRSNYFSIIGLNIASVVMQVLSLPKYHFMVIGQLLVDSVQSIDNLSFIKVSNYLKCSSVNGNLAGHVEVCKSYRSMHVMLVGY